MIDLLLQNGAGTGAFDASPRVLEDAREVRSGLPGLGARPQLHPAWQDDSRPTPRPQPTALAQPLKARAA
jgi:hypothetical protein